MRESGSTPSKRIQVWRLDFFVSKSIDRVKTLVVSKDENDVRFLIVRAASRTNGEQTQ
jgi:hypothetical protein